MRAKPRVAPLNAHTKVVYVEMYRDCTENYRIAIAYRKTDYLANSCIFWL